MFVRQNSFLGSAYSGADILAYLKQQGFVDAGGNVTNAMGVYNAAWSFGVTGPELDAAIPMAPGTADKFVADNHLAPLIGVAQDRPPPAAVTVQRDPAWEFHAGDIFDPMDQRVLPSGFLPVWNNTHPTMRYADVVQQYTYDGRMPIVPNYSTQGNSVQTPVVVPQVTTTPAVVSPAVVSPVSLPAVVSPVVVASPVITPAPVVNPVRVVSTPSVRPVSSAVPPSQTPAATTPYPDPADITGSSPLRVDQQPTGIGNTVSKTWLWIALAAAAVVVASK